MLILDYESYIVHLYILYTSYHRRKPTEDNGSIHKIINTLSKSKILRMSRSSFTLALCLKKKKNKQTAPYHI